MDGSAPTTSDGDGTPGNGAPAPAAGSQQEIPLIDVGAEGPLALIEHERARFEDLLGRGKAHYSRSVLAFGDRVSRRWLKRVTTPYKQDLHDVAAGAPLGTGIYMLNLSYEWACTSAVGAPPSGDGNRLLRTLDWPLDGLGRNVVIARHAAEAGPWFNVTWPGFVGSATGMAPGRFSIAINQPPMKKFTGSCWFDWFIERGNILRRTFIPPVHLLRQVFETCRTYGEAKKALCETPISMPTFYSLSGTAAADSCIIERTETQAFVREGEEAVANHWIANPDTGRMRGFDSPGRYKLMTDLAPAVNDDFDWVREPILNPATRLAVTANAGQGTLAVQGFEKTGAATQVRRVQA